MSMTCQAAHVMGSQGLLFQMPDRLSRRLLGLLAGKRFQVDHIHCYLCEMLVYMTQDAAQMSAEQWHYGNITVRS